MNLSLKAISISRAGMVVHELSKTGTHRVITERCAEGLIVFPENEKTHSTSTEAAVNMSG